MDRFVADSFTNGQLASHQEGWDRMGHIYTTFWTLLLDCAAGGCLAHPLVDAKDLSG